MVKTSRWGDVNLYELSGGGITVKVSDLGGIITSIQTPDKNGTPGEITLGYDTPEEYIKDDAFFGATVGRYANRIANAAFTLNGVLYNLTKNDGNNHLHGGVGFHKTVWKTERIMDNGVILSIQSPDGEDGYPGNVKVTAEFRLEGNRLNLDLTGETDKDTIMNLTNHAYFNLRGHGDVLDHKIQINANGYNPVNEELIPTGEIVPVEGTDFDFRQMRIIKNGDYDHNFVLNSGNVSVSVEEPETGRTLKLGTNMPGVQLYCGMSLTERIGLKGQAYKKYSGFCLEPQYFPNSPNVPEFPRCILKKGEVYRHNIYYEFGNI